MSHIRTTDRNVLQIWIISIAYHMHIINHNWLNHASVCTPCWSYLRSADHIFKATITLGVIYATVIFLKHQKWKALQQTFIAEIFKAIKRPTTHAILSPKYACVGQTASLAAQFWGYKWPAEKEAQCKPGGGLQRHFVRSLAIAKAFGALTILVDSTELKTSTSKRLPVIAGLRMALSCSNTREPTRKLIDPFELKESYPEINLLTLVKPSKAVLLRTKAKRC